MGILHRHDQRGVTQDALQREDVAAVHHVVAGERVAQDVPQLPGCQIEPHRFYRLPRISCSSHRT